MSDDKTSIKIKLIQTDFNRFEWLVTQIRGFPTKRETEEMRWWRSDGKYLYMETIDGRNKLTVFEGFAPKRMDNISFVLEEGKTSPLGGDAKTMSAIFVLNTHMDMIQERMLSWNAFVKSKNDVTKLAEEGKEIEYEFGDAGADVMWFQHVSDLISRESSTEKEEREKKEREKSEKRVDEIKKDKLRKMISAREKAHALVNLTKSVLYGRK